MLKIILILVLLVLSVGVQAQSGPDAEIAKLNTEMAAHYRKGDFDVALPTAGRIVEIAVARFGRNDLTTAKALKNRGMIENARGDSKKAAETFSDAADIFKKQPDLDKADAANFAELLEILGGIKLRERSPSAESTLELALKWREKANGPDAVEIIQPLAGLANLKFWNREYKPAAELYKRALLLAAKNPKGGADDLSILYYRSECTFRKAKMEADFEPLKSTYSEQRKHILERNKQASLIEGGVLNGKAVSLAKPAYPAEARQARAEGTVSVQVLIGESGHVLSACGVTEKVHPALIEASEISAYNSTFSPTTLAGLPVKVSGVITYNFRR